MRLQKGLASQHFSTRAIFLNSNRNSSKSYNRTHRRLRTEKGDTTVVPGEDLAIVAALFFRLNSAQILPLLQRDRDIAVFPNEIMEGADAEFVALLHARVGEKFHDLQFPDLVSNGLTRTSGKRDCLLTRGLFVHRD